MAKSILVPASDFIVKNGKKHFKCLCPSCGTDRGYQIKKHIDRECHSCSASTRRSNNLKSFFRTTCDKTEVYCKQCSKWYENTTVFWIIDPRRIGYDAYTCRMCAKIKNKINRIKRIPTQCRMCASAIGADTKHLLCRSCYMANQGSFRKKRRSRNEVHEKRYQNDALYRLDKCIRALIYRSLRGKKLNKTEQYLGCSIEQFKKHLESKFQPGMSWDNYGRNGWHIDHIVPSSSASSVEELVRLQHFSNLQPLWEVDNLRKGASLS